MADTVPVTEERDWLQWEEPTFSLRHKGMCLPGLTEGLAEGASPEEASMDAGCQGLRRSEQGGCMSALPRAAWVMLQYWPPNAGNGAPFHSHKWKPLFRRYIYSYSKAYRASQERPLRD